MPRVRRRPGHDALGPEQAGRLLELAVVDQARALVEAVGHRLEEDRRRRDALGVRLVAVREVAAVGEVEAHDAVVRVEQGGVDLVEGEGGRRAEEEEEEQGGREVEREKRNRARAFFLALSLSREQGRGQKSGKREKKLFPSPTHLEVGRRARQRLHVDAPLLRVEAEGRQRTLLAEGLGLVDELVAAVVAGA